MDPGVKNGHSDTSSKPGRDFFLISDNPGAVSVMGK